VHNRLPATDQYDEAVPNRRPLPDQYDSAHNHRPLPDQYESLVPEPVPNYVSSFHIKPDDERAANSATPPAEHERPVSTLFTGHFDEQSIRSKRVSVFVEKTWKCFEF